MLDYAWQRHTCRPGMSKRGGPVASAGKVFVMALALALTFCHSLPVLHVYSLPFQSRRNLDRPITTPFRLRIRGRAFRIGSRRRHAGRATNDSCRRPEEDIRMRGLCPCWGVAVGIRIPSLGVFSSLVASRMQILSLDFVSKDGLSLPSDWAVEVPSTLKRQRVDMQDGQRMTAVAVRKRTYA
jgi:hypothetical protein